MNPCPMRIQQNFLAPFAANRQVARKMPHLRLNRSFALAVLTIALLTGAFLAIFEFSSSSPNNQTTNGSPTSRLVSSTQTPSSTTSYSTSSSVSQTTPSSSTSSQSSSATRSSSSRSTSTSSTSSTTTTSSSSGLSSSTSSSSSSSTSSSSSSSTSSLGANVTCTQVDGNVADPSAPHGLFVLSPATKPTQQYYSSVVNLLANQNVCGANFFVPWSSIDSGPTSSPQYNWTVLDELQPWIQAGKVVNLIVWAVNYGGGIPATPAYVLSQVDHFPCNGSTGPSQIIPIYWEQPFVTSYHQFMSAMLQRYGTNSAVGYIRFGLGGGGETNVARDFVACKPVLQKYGYTDQVWQNYIGQMLDYEKSLTSPKQLMLGISQLYDNNFTFPDFEAARAVQDGIGFGSQGLEKADIQQFDSGKPCHVDYCRLFQVYSGKVPLELQTIAASSPDGSGTGSLVDLIPFGLRLHTQIFELYFDDWLTAYEPSYPNYAMYHVAYANALSSASSVLGFSPKAFAIADPQKGVASIMTASAIFGPSSSLGCPEARRARTRDKRIVGPSSPPQGRIGQSTCLRRHLRRISRDGQRGTGSIAARKHGLDL